MLSECNPEAQHENNFTFLARGSFRSAGFQPADFSSFRAGSKPAGWKPAPQMPATCLKRKQILEQTYSFDMEAAFDPAPASGDFRTR
jgi:hypothetical protein